jgi:hypothetical protein
MVANPQAEIFLRVLIKWIFGAGNYIDIDVGGEIHIQFEELRPITEIEVASGKTEKKATSFGQIRRAETEANVRRRSRKSTLKAVRDARRDIFARAFNPLSGAYDIIDRAPGPVRVETAASQLGVSTAQLLETAGVKSKVRSSLTLTKLDKAAKARLQEMLEIVNRISVWAGGKEQALAWYRAEPIPAFGSRTAESLVKEGKAAAVRDYLDHVAMGGFA